MPSLLYLRPGDSEEVAGAWIAALNHNGPSIISVSRHAIPQFPSLTSRTGVAKGAYILRSPPDASITLIATGAELSFAINVADALLPHGITARVVSFPSHDLFRHQPLSYQREVLQRDRMPAVVIEPYVCVGWERWADAGVHMKGFGHSLPGKYIYGHFGFEVGRMVEKVKGFFEEWEGGKVGRGEYVEL